MFEGNNLLATLNDEDRELLAANASVCEFKAGDTLYEPGQTVDQCYIPAGPAIGSYFIHLESGVSIETVMIGREGALGGIVSNGGLPSFARSSVMHEGTFFRIPVPDLHRAKQKSLGIKHMFDRYADCLMAQVFQSIACNAIHTIEQRAAKWLNAAVERTGSADITMTQEQLAAMMGVGRSYTSRVIQRFKRTELVRTRRGGIEVLDHDGLEQRSCTCNDTVREHFDIVLKGVYPD